MLDHCSHGVKWKDACEGCAAVSATGELRDLIRDCDRVAKFLSEKPGLASDPSVTIDLYEAVARLAKILITSPVPNGGTEHG